MAALISNGNVNLSAANAFYEVEAFNAGFASTTNLALTSTRTASFTPLHATNALGIVIGLTPSSTAPDRDVTCTLKQSGVSRASATLTAASIVNSNTDGSGLWIVPFTFSASYALTTGAGVWTVDITQGAGSVNWSVATSNGTAVSYALWGDGAKTFSSTNDWIICKDVVTVDSTATLKGAALATGDTTRSLAAIICKSTSPAVASVANLVWGTGGSYTLTVDGNILLGAHSGFRAGTSTGSPITVANAGTLSFSAPTLGTLGSFTSAAGSRKKMSLFIFGEIPSVERTTLNGNHGGSSTTVNVSTSTGWSNGDSVMIGGREAGDTTIRTLNGAAGASSLTLNTTTAAATYYSGWYVARMNGYGFKLTHSAQQDATLGLMSNFTLSGVQVEKIRFGMADNSLSQNVDETANTSAPLVSHCSWINTASHMISTIYSYTSQFKIEYVNCCNGMAINTFSQNDSNTNGGILIDNCFIGQTVSSAGSATTLGLPVISYTNNQIQGALGGIASQGFLFDSNKLMAATSSAIMSLAGCASNASWTNNTWSTATTAISLSGTNVNLVMSGDNFASPNAVTNAFKLTANTYQSIRIVSPTGTPVINSTDMQGVIDGTRIWIENYNGTSKRDQNYTKRGVNYRTGYGIDDTNVISADSSSLTNAGSSTTFYGSRLESYTGSTVIRYRNTSANAPFTRVTGDATGKQITVTAKVYIPHADFYTGTYTLPTLSVVDNDGTTRTAVATAATGLQTIQVSWAPATSGTTYTYELYGASAAAGTTTINGITVNKKAFYVVYVDAGTYAGGSVDNTKLQVWLQAQVQNAEATLPTPTSVWEVPKAVASATANSIGEVVQDTNGLVSV